MSVLLVFVLGLPALFWPEGLETAPALRSAGIEGFLAPPETAEAWRREGWSVTPVTREDLAAREALPAPGRLREQVELASATRSPWITANGWRMQRQPGGRCAYRLPAGRAALAAAEAFAYGMDAVLEIDPADLGALGGMLTFVSDLEASALPSAADFAVVDDGSPVTGEVMNLLARRNLLYEVVTAPTSRFASTSSRARRVIPWRRRRTRPPSPSASGASSETTPARSESTGARWSWAVSPPEPRGPASTFSTTEAGRSTPCGSG